MVENGYGRCATQNSISTARSTRLQHLVECRKTAEEKSRTQIPRGVSRYTSRSIIDLGRVANCLRLRTPRPDRLQLTCGDG